MFLDPEPRNTRRPHSQTEFQGFIAPLASPIDQRIIRKPLLERTPNQSLQKLEHEDEPQKPTVRLVRQTPSVATLRKELFGEHGDKVPLVPFKQRRNSSPDSTRRGKPIGLEVPTTIVDVDNSIDDSIQSAASDDLPSWKRRSISSSNFSNATTLRGSEGASAYARSDRVSSGTTARELSTLHDTSLEDVLESNEEAGPLDDTDYSATTYDYEESLAERQTIKPVLASLKSYEREVSQADTPRPRSRRQTWSSTDSEPASSPPARVFAPEIPPRISSMHQTSLSITSLRQSPVASSSFSSSPRQLDASPSLPSVTTSAAASPVQSEASAGNFQPFQSAIDYDAFLSSPVHDAHQPSPIRNALQPSPNYDAFPSSPNFIAYDSSPTRPRSRSSPLRGEPSYESITSRLRTGQHTLAPSASWSSVDPASSMDTLPSLHVPRRRLRQVRGSHSLDLDRRMQDSHQQGHSFSGNLSTIASESERSRSRTASQQFAVSQNFSSGWPSRLASRADSTAFDEPGDMTLGLFREESAMPEPLFRAPSPVYAAPGRGQAYVLPPLPPMPHDFEEGHDTLADLASSLRLKRSGYSLRGQRSNSSLRHQQSNSSLHRSLSSSTSLRHQRSQSTPLHTRHMSITSISESERWSSGSLIFPMWAKLYYTGHITLANMSQISLQPLPTPPGREGAQNGMRFDRFPSQRYQRSITATPSTVMMPSEPATAATTPSTTRYIVPALFRPRNKSRQVSRTIESIVLPDTDAIADTDRDSMVIEPIAPADASHIDVPPSKASSPSRSPRRQRKTGLSLDKPLPQQPSTQQQQRQSHDWSRPIPHLAPTKRASAHLNTWRPPSFVESIDLIFKSRGHRQILFFLVGFICPLAWWIAAFTPLPPRPTGLYDQEQGGAESGVDVAEHTEPKTEAMSSEMTAARWREEQAWRQGVWWRNVNRVMSVLGLLIIGAVIAIAVVATR